MPKRLYTYCCRLCLHDGSVHELFDIFTVEGLGRKLLNIFNIKITPQDACTTNICLTCFNEALTLDRQMQLFKKQKQTVLDNQQRLNNKGPAAARATSELSSVALPEVPAAVLTTSSEAQQSAADSTGDDGPETLNFSPITIPGKDLDETNNQTRQGSKEATDKKRL
uniref:Uncharacterized protein n=1 Tax=Anopheles stephensi TaxID=30069 RepID=A0A182YSW7_ANOST